jgi:hypothetical protein
MGPFKYFNTFLAFLLPVPPSPMCFGGTDADNFSRVARLKFEKIAIFVRKNSQNSHLIISPKSAKILFQNITVQGKVKILIKKSKI